MKRAYLVDIDDERNTLVRGPIRDTLKAHGVPALRSARHGGWFVRNERVADLVALLEHEGFKVGRSAR